MSIPVTTTPQRRTPRVDAARSRSAGQVPYCQSVSPRQRGRAATAHLGVPHFDGGDLGAGGDTQYAPPVVRRRSCARAPAELRLVSDAAHSAWGAQQQCAQGLQLPTPCSKSMKQWKAGPHTALGCSLVRGAHSTRPAHQVPWPSSSFQAAGVLFSTPPTQLAERVRSMFGARSAAAAAAGEQTCRSSIRPARSVLLLLAGRCGHEFRPQRQDRPECLMVHATYGDRIMSHLGASCRCRCPGRR
jgi:hypothetical protein